MTYPHIKLGVILIMTTAISTVRFKLRFQKGINCNLESFQSVTHRVINRYFCVPKSGCSASPHRIPVIPFDLCNDYYDGVNGEELECCHQSDFKEKPDELWTGSYLFLPSVKSYIMCRHYSHLLCAEDGTSYCDKTTLQLKTSISTEGIPQIIEQFPHTAIIGYPTDSENKTFRWFCMGSIVSERVILTASNCEYELVDRIHQFSTHVRVGESIICDNCKDQPGEQLIPIRRWELDLKEKSDIYFILLTKDIEFNQKVRPACLLRQPNLPTNGWYVHYGKPERDIMTAKTFWPVFHYPMNSTFITFKVKTAENAVIYLSETGTPNKMGRNWQVILGKIKDGSMRTEIKLLGKFYETTTFKDTPNIVNQNEFRGFWIRVGQNGTLSVGEEDQTTAFINLTNPNCCFDVAVIGLSTPSSTGQWVFGNHEGLFSLNGVEVSTLWKDKCAEYHSNFETAENYASRTNDQNYVGEQEFCAGDLHKGVAPCDHDWGSTIQMMDRFNLPCMWQMYGMYSQDEKRNCSAINSPGIFVNFANHLAYIEETAYPSFTYHWFNLKVDRPLCLLPSSNRSDPGRCPAYIVPK